MREIDYLGFMKFFNQLDQPIVKKHLLIAGLGSVFGLLLHYYFQTSHASEESSSTTITVLLAALCGIAIAYSTFYLSKKLDHITPWKSQLANRFLLGILLEFLCAMLIVIAFSLSCKHLFHLEFVDSYDSVMIKLGIILFMVMLIYNVIYFALYSYYSYAKLQIDAIAYDRKQIDLQLKALKSQLSAHFLFNNLNTISSLVYKDLELTENYIRGLANIYSYTLNSYNSKLVSLREELGFVSSYLLLLETRFGKAFNYNINIHDALLDSQIPPLTLQMLVENSVKHNQMNAEHQLQIDIESSSDFISVKNNLTQPPNKVTSFNIGLKNIEARYKLLSSLSIDIEKTTHFEVKIPIIKS